MSLAYLDGYRATGIDTVPGWFRHQDLQLFEDILVGQLKHRTRGDILEIGCYHGKSAIALGYGLRSGERLHVNDLFGIRPEGISDEGLAAYDGLDREAFLTQYLAWHPEPPIMHTGSSTTLKGTLAGHKFRFIHIDGGHAYTTVRSDIHTAIELSMTDTVIVLDDFRTSHTPGVSAAVWEAASQGWLFPFALTGVKLYAAASRHAQAEWVQELLGMDYDWDTHQIHGQTVLRISDGA
jgi:hypothetical protein